LNTLRNHRFKSFKEDEMIKKYKQKWKLYDSMVKSKKNAFKHLMKFKKNLFSFTKHKKSVIAHFKKTMISSQLSFNFFNDPSKSGIVYIDKTGVHDLFDYIPEFKVTEDFYIHIETKDIMQIIPKCKQAVIADLSYSETYMQDFIKPIIDKNILS
jgi:hypothetical protein